MQGAVRFWFIVGMTIPFIALWWFSPKDAMICLEAVMRLTLYHFHIYNSGILLLNSSSISPRRCHLLSGTLTENSTAVHLQRR